MADEQQGRSPWFWVGCGCVSLVLLGLATCVGLGLAGKRWAENLETSMTDPVARTEKAAEILGTDAFPENYHAMMAMEIPFLMKMALLSTEEPDENGQINDMGEEGLFYFDFIRLDSGELRPFFTGETDNPRALRDADINLDLDERLSNGQVASANGNILWVSHLGEIGFAANQSDEGIATLFLVECDTDKRGRFGAWYGPLPEAALAEDAPRDLTTLDYTGTQADPSEVDSFLGRMTFCNAP